MNRKIIYILGIGLISIVLLLCLKDFTSKNSNEKIYTYESEYIVQDIQNSTNFLITLFEETSNTSYPIVLSDKQIPKYKTYKIGDVIIATMEIRTDTKGNIVNKKLILP